MDNPLERISKDLVAYYKRADVLASSAQQVGWKDEIAQRRRFDQLLKIINRPAPFSINDFGCGLGDLSQYMSEQGFQNFDYAGYDMLDSMVDRSRKLYDDRYPNRHFFLVSHPEQMKVSDFTVASGVLNIRFNIPDTEWMDYFLAMISVFNSKSRSGFAFNALTSYSDSEHLKKELYYADPCVIFDFCKRNFSRNVALLHDYDEYDFTILVRK